MITQNLLKLTASSLLLALVAACGGGGADAPTAGNTDALISGVAAVGAPLAKATVVVKDANNETVTTEAGDDGSYKANVSGKVAPFMIKATGVVGGVSTSYYSALETAPKAGETLTANVTPLTHAIVAQSASGDPETVFADVKANKASIDATKVQAAKDKLVAALNDYIVALGGAANADPIKTKFSANSKDALDKVLDLVKVNTQITGSGASSKADVSLTANGGVTTTVTQADTTATVTAKKMNPPTEAEIALDTSTMQNTLAGINAAMASSSAFGTNGANFAAWFDDAYLDAGRDKAGFVASLASALNGTTADIKWGSKFENPVIQSCNTTTKICEVMLTINKTNGVYESFPTTVKFNTTSNKWLAYGDRRAFQHELNWVTQKATDGTYSYGMNLYIPFNREQTYDAAYLTFSTNSGTTVYQAKDSNGVLKDLSMEFGRPLSSSSGGSCSNSPSFLVFNRFQFTDSNGSQGGAIPNCNNSNFFALGSTATEINANIQGYNTALTAGTLRYKIKLLNTTTGATKIQDWVRPKPVLGILTSNVADYSSYFPTATTSQLGTNSVAFSAIGKIETVQIRVKTNTNFTGTTSWGGTGAIASLNSVATVAKANALCVSGGGTQANCDASYGTNAVISWMYLSSRDAQGRQYWAGYGIY